MRHPQANREKHNRGTLNKGQAEMKRAWNLAVSAASSAHYVPTVLDGIIRAPGE
jgi:hypothetical protein